jgi:VWFA-related protein
MLNKSIWLVILCLSAAVFAPQTPGQEKTPSDDVIKINTTLISIPVIVTDRQGRYVPDLKQADFGILQDGVERQIDFFANAEELINIAVLIDTSSSTRDVLGDIKSAAKKMVKQLNADDRAMIVSFDYAPHVLCPLTADKDELEKAIKKAEIPEDRGTTLRDAVDETVRRQFGDVKGRKAIILLTDGKDHGSAISPADLLYSLAESDVLVYCVYFDTTGPRPDVRRELRVHGTFGDHRRGGYPGGGRSSRYPPADRPRNTQRNERIATENEYAISFLRKLSDVTGGRFYDSSKTKFKEAFELIVDELRHQYRIGYYPPDEGKLPHSLRVKVMRPDVVVRARSNYKPKAQ